MSNHIEILCGEYSNKGRKEINQDFHAIRLPQNNLITTKGVVAAIADGISSSKVSQEASQFSIEQFVKDYFATSDSWSVKKSAITVLQAINNKIYDKNKQDHYHLDKDRGYITTFSSIIFKSNTAYIFHIGDCRVLKLRNSEFSQLTTDHRINISKEKSYLARAIGVDNDVKVDYETTDLLAGDIFMLATDGVYEYIDNDFINKTLDKYSDDLDTASKIIIDKAYENGSTDNLTIQLIKIQGLPDKNLGEIYNNSYIKPIADNLKDNAEFDGYLILHKLSHTPRSQTYLALDNTTKSKVVIKLPSVELRNDATYIESFLLEEWVANRVNNPYIVKAYNSNREHNFLYIVTEYAPGKSLSQWMIDNPHPNIDKVRTIAKQIATGLLALHRQEMIYQDLRPENIIIDEETQTLKIIDFGSVCIKSLDEISNNQYNLRGTAQYSAPEYFLGENGSYQSDLFSLGVIVYEMIAAKLPYGIKIARTKTPKEQKKLMYDNLYPEQPIWVDLALKKAVNISPNERYQELSEFLYDLSHPNKEFTNTTKPPLIEHNPVLFYKSSTIILIIIIFILLYYKV